MFRFKCNRCDKWHEEMPTLGYEAPLYYEEVPVGERGERCSLNTDVCVIDDQFFFVKGCLEIPVHGENAKFSYGVWVSLSKASFQTFLEHYNKPVRSHFGVFFGWLSNRLPLYPDTLSLKTNVHMRDYGIRPYIELGQTDHPLAIEQREGIHVTRVGEIYGYHVPH